MRPSCVASVRQQAWFLSKGAADVLTGWAKAAQLAHGCARLRLWREPRLAVSLLFQHDDAPCSMWSVHTLLGPVLLAPCSCRGMKDRPTTVCTA
jgi:hypothetical protein